MNGPSWFNYIGRFAFPIFAFQISEGFVHTKNVKKYLLRLLTFAFISQIPCMLFYSLISDELVLNVIFTLLFGLLSIICYNNHKYLGIVAVILLGSVAEYLHFDYGFYGVAITFLFYALRNNKIHVIFGFLVATIINYTHTILGYMSYGIGVLNSVFNFYMPYIIFTMLSILFIVFYNKKKGPNTRYLLYLFYPLHLLLVYGINLILL